MDSKQLTIMHPDWQAWADVLTNRESFTTYGSMFGERTDGSIRGTGRMAYMHAALIYENRPDYVIYSYDTPIAWHSPSYGWCIPDAGYSATTKRQLHRVRTALDLAGVDVFIA